MVQPLKSARTTWTIFWIDLEEPLPAGEDFILPTLLIVIDASGSPVAPPEILEELDQARIETLLGNLIDRLGAPDRLIIGESEDWDEDAWTDFAEDFNVSLQFNRPTSRNRDELSTITQKVVAHYATNQAPERRALATGLVNTALRVRSESKKIALLKKAIDSDADCSPAHVELGDAEFRRGDWNRALREYDATIAREQPRWEPASPTWWSDRETRPYLRATFGRAMTLWHQGRHLAAAEGLNALLKTNPTDHQGARFLIPMVFLLAEDYEAAENAFVHYEQHYPQDYVEPALLFGWGLLHAHFGRDAEGVEKFARAVVKNVYIAPQLLDLPVPTSNLWQPSDRADGNYARDFLDSYAILWERVPSATRALRDALDRQTQLLADIIDLRARMFDYQDQRYDPDYKATWRALTDQDEALTK